MSVTSLDEYRAANGIELLMGQVWPANRLKGDFRKERAEAADLELRRVICAHCEKRSRLLDGPTGRAWWESHKTICKGSP